MSQKARLKRNIETARRLTDTILSSFKGEKEWTHQVHPKANHPLWIAGHLGQVDDFFVSMVAPDRRRPIEAWVGKFGMGSQPIPDISAYPPAEDVLAYLRERRQTLLSVLEEHDDDWLSQSTPPGTPEFLPDNASVFEMAVWHEGMHAGQLTMAHRALGYPPVMGQP
ncbi:MAG: DinB family protein [Planctomycetia bacterium]|nr:DinB family protein [Planctomycetia bacterium]